MYQVKSLNDVKDVKKEVESIILDIIQNYYLTRWVEIHHSNNIELSPILKITYFRFGQAVCFYPKDDILISDNLTIRTANTVRRICVM